MLNHQPTLDQTYVVTGATSGLGEATARALAMKGAEVIVVGRDAAKCAATVERITRESGNPRVSWQRADLSARQEVTELAGRLVARGQPLHALINNAGIIAPGRELSADGIELTWATNYLGPFLLTNLLLDTLEASAPARVVNVCSASQAEATINFDDLGYQRGFRPFRAYAQSKLALLSFTYELARRVDGTGVTVNAANPGLVWTKLGQNGWAGRLGQRLIHLRYRGQSVGPEEGASTIVYLASSPEVAGVNGRYFTGRHAETTSPLSRDEAVARRLWDVSLAMVGLQPATA